VVGVYIALGICAVPRRIWGEAEAYVTPDRPWVVAGVTIALGRIRAV
jgi:hypothetical protein